MIKIIQKILCLMNLHRGREIRQMYGMSGDGYFICSYCPSIESEFIWEGRVEDHRKITKTEAREMVLELNDALRLSYDATNGDGTLTRTEYKAMRKDNKRLKKRFMEHVGDWEPAPDKKNRVVT